MIKIKENTLSFKKKSKNKGSVLALVTVFIFIFTILGLLAMRVAVMQNADKMREMNIARTYYAADGTAEQAAWRMYLLYTNTGKTFHPASNKTITRPVIQRAYWNGDYYYTATYENFTIVYDTVAERWYPAGTTNSFLYENYTFPDVYARVWVEKENSPKKTDGYISTVTPLDNNLRKITIGPDPDRPGFTLISAWIKNGSLNKYDKWITLFGTKLGTTLYYVITAVGESSDTNNTYSSEVKFHYCIEKTIEIPLTKPSGTVDGINIEHYTDPNDGTGVQGYAMSIKTALLLNNSESIVFRSRR